MSIEPSLKPSRGVRPTEFKSEYCAKVTALLKLAPHATNPEIAEFLGISLRSVERYQQRIPEFREAIKDGKAHADAQVASSLYERATGAVVFEDVVVGKGEAARIERLQKRLPPDTAAAFIWLKNRRPQDWKDRVESVNYDVKLDLVEYAKEYARRIGPEAAKRFLEDHGYKGRTIDLLPESVRVED